MRYTIAGALMRDAIECLKQAQLAHSENCLEDETRFSIGAQSMLALAIESVSSEVGEMIFEPWAWQRLDKYDTPLKWYFISQFDGRKPFDPSTEPLQTVQRLTAIRERIALPRLEDFCDEIMSSSKGLSFNNSINFSDHIIDTRSSSFVLN
jgi:hypothetical protein